MYKDGPLQTCLPFPRSPPSLYLLTYLHTYSLRGTLLLRSFSRSNRRFITISSSASDTDCEVTGASDGLSFLFVYSVALVPVALILLISLPSFHLPSFPTQSSHTGCAVLTLDYRAASSTCGHSSRWSSYDLDPATPRVGAGWAYSQTLRTLIGHNHL